VGRTVENRVNDTPSEISTPSLASGRDPYRLRRTSLFRDQDHTVLAFSQMSSQPGDSFSDHARCAIETIGIPHCVRDFRNALES
jgi:hypothetical protein